jgi:hypothetical protein
MATMWKCQVDEGWVIVTRGDRECGELDWIVMNDGHHDMGPLVFKTEADVDRAIAYYEAENAEDATRS